MCGVPSTGPYRHVMVSRKAPVCQAFLKGFCPLGVNCTDRHVLESRCPTCRRPISKCPCGPDQGGSDQAAREPASLARRQSSDVAMPRSFLRLGRLGLPIGFEQKAHSRIISAGGGSKSDSDRKVRVHMVALGATGLTTHSLTTKTSVGSNF